MDIRYSFSKGVCEDRGRQKSMYQGSNDAVFAGAFSRVFIVADGVGGGEGVKEASRMAADYVGERLSSLGWEDRDYRRDISEAVVGANEMVCHMGEAYRKVPGTTLAFAFFRGPWMYVASVGDSRVYRMGLDGRLELLTEDDTPIGRLVKEGKMTPKDILTSERNELLRYLGKCEELEVDVERYPVEFGRVLLATDGLTDLVTDEEIRNVLLEDIPLKEAAEKLVNLANYPKAIAMAASELSMESRWPFREQISEAEAREALGGKDNISVVVVGVEEA